MFLMNAILQGGDKSMLSLISGSDESKSLGTRWLVDKIFRLPKKRCTANFARIQLVGVKAHVFEKF